MSDNVVLKKGQKCCWKCRAIDYREFMFPVATGTSFRDIKVSYLCERCFNEVGALPPPPDPEDEEATELEPEEVAIDVEGGKV